MSSKDKCNNNTIIGGVQNRNSAVRQDVVNAARDVSLSAHGCDNPAEDKYGQDRLVSVFDMAWSGLKIAGSRARQGFNELTGDEKAAKTAKIDAERAENELSGEWRHYGLSDLAVDVGTTVIGGAAGRLVFRGAVGLAGKAGFLQNKAVVQEAASGGYRLLGTLTDTTESAFKKAGATLASVETAVGNQVKDKAADILVKAADKAHDLSNTAKEASNLLDAAERTNHKSSIVGRQARETPLQFDVIVGKQGQKTFDAGTVSGIIGAAMMRQSFSTEGQVTAKSSSDTRIEMRQIADELHKQDKPINTQMLLEVHEQLKNRNLDKGEPERQGLDVNEQKALKKIVKNMVVEPDDLMP